MRSGLIASWMLTVFDFYVLFCASLTDFFQRITKKKKKEFFPPKYLRTQKTDTQYKKCNRFYKTNNSKSKEENNK